MLGHYRLRGEVGGVERTYALDPATSRVGSMADNEVVLPVRGVSRHHAQLSFDAGGLLLEDLGSRNGTLRNGVRIRRAPVRPGDEIRFGPVRLRLEEVDQEDARLALEVDVEAPDGRYTPAAQTTTGLVGGSGGDTDWWAMVESMVARLGNGTEADLAAALALLVNGLPARGACVVEWAAGRDATVVTASGRVEDPMSHPDFVDFVSHSLQQQGLTTAILPEASGLSAAVLASGPREALALVIWGDFPRRQEHEAVLRLLARLLARCRSLPAPAATLDPAADALVLPEGFVRGHSAAMTALYAQMAPLLEGDLPVLLVGETGVGKEYLAAALHLSSPRRHGPFVAINCAAIPAELLEAEMFGIGKGVATGVAERPGKFRLAEGGTLFLDEIGDMPLDLQAKLLRALQEKEIHPVGSRPVAVDIRVVAATNMDLPARMEQGRFRSDLYYRVAGYALRVPPLRERREDIPVLVEQFIRRSGARAGKVIRGITVKALRRLVEHSWPGNVRQLEHEVRRLVYRCPDGQAIDSTMLSDLAGGAEAGSARDGSSMAAHPEAAPEARMPAGYHEAVNEAKRRVVLKALDDARGRFTEAAKALGVHPNYLHRLVKVLHLEDAVKKQRLS